MDGTAWVNQCPIIPSCAVTHICCICYYLTTFSDIYKFNVPDQSGTCWYQSHDSTQYCDGLRGALVVYDPDDPYADDYDVDDGK